MSCAEVMPPVLVFDEVDDGMGDELVLLYAPLDASSDDGRTMVWREATYEDEESDTRKSSNLLKAQCG